ncbi:MAG: hypothetical protein JW909_11875 [Planctomycetes bacterium]|nr:hypothetical protein [Planctomycetota bacterium]
MKTLPRFRCRVLVAALAAALVLAAGCSNKPKPTEENKAKILSSFSMQMSALNQFLPQELDLRFDGYDEKGALKFQILDVSGDEPVVIWNGRDNGKDYVFSRAD